MSTCLQVLAPVPLYTLPATWELFDHSLDSKRWQVTDLESKTSANITSRSTLRPAVGAALPLGTARHPGSHLPAAQGHSWPLTQPQGPGAMEMGHRPLQQEVKDSIILLLWVPMLGLLPGAAPGGKHRALGPGRCCHEQVTRCFSLLPFDALVPQGLE